MKRFGKAAATTFLLIAPLLAMNGECQDDELYLVYKVHGRDKAIQRIHEGLIPEARSEWNAALLQEAINHFDLTFVSILLEKGVDPNAKSPRELNAIQVAAGPQPQGASPEYYEVFEDIMRLLLKNGADIETLDKVGRTPLMIAASEGNEAAIRGLLKFDPLLNTKDVTGLTALMMAVAGNHVGSVRLLIEAGADVNIKEKLSGKTILMESVSGQYAYGQDELITKMLLSAGAKVNEQNKSGITALMYAVQNGKKYAEELLLSAGADSENIANYGFLNAIENRDIKRCKELIADINVNFKDESGYTFLMLAAKNHITEVMQELLTEGADVNATTPTGETALMIACESYNFPEPNVLKVLLKAKANVNSVDVNGFTALNRIINSNQSMPFAEILLEAGADPNYVSKNASPFLFSAIQNANIELAKLLVKFGADVNKKYQETSSLALSIENKNAEMTSFLISKEAHDPSIQKEAEEIAKDFVQHEQELIDRIGTETGPVEISLKGTSCCGMCPAFSLSVNESGEVHFNGGENVDIQGTQSYSIPKDRVKEILLEALRVKFFSLQAVPSYGEIGPPDAFIAINWKEREKILNAKDDSRLISLKEKILELCEVQSRLKTNLNFLQTHAEDKFIRDVDLIYVVANGSPEIIKFLLQKGVNPNKRDEYNYSALAAAAGRGSFEMTQMLLNAGAQVDALAINYAANSSETDILNLLFIYAKETTSLKEATPLHTAALNVDAIKVMKFLILKGYDVNQRDENGNTPLIIAAENRNFPALEVLIASGADVNITNHFNITALLAAIDAVGIRAYGSHANSKDNIEIIKALLAAGTSTNATDNEGRTALHFTAMTSDYSASRVLIQAGADSMVRDEYGSSAVYYAEHNPSKVILELFPNQK